MSKFVTRITAAAALALAALPIVALGAAHAETRAVVAVADLDFANPADVARFDARVDRAASKVCSGSVRGGLRAAVNCEAAVKAEAAEKLGSRQAARMVAAKSPAPAFVTAAN